MAIFIRITDADVETSLMALKSRQPARVALTALAEAILVRVVAACSDDPEAWKKIGQPAAPAAGNGSVGTPEIHGAPTNHPATGPVTDSPDQASSSLPKPSGQKSAPDGEQPSSAIASPGPGTPPSPPGS